MPTDKVQKYWLRITDYRYIIIAVIITLLWCIPLIATGQRIEWGDFSFFAQGYQAFKVSIFEYGQFPWYNPWVSGGVPLYANPQFGLFSIQTIFVFIFGAVAGLKVALAFYTICGLMSMYLLLRKYFNVPQLASSGLSLVWIFGGFFVAHLPTHFTFVWYMLAPLFIYMSLTVMSKRSAVLLGASFGIMALSQTHNPFVHISIISAAIVLSRLIYMNNIQRLTLLKSLVLSLVVFLALAGHRIFYTLQNIMQFPREGMVDLAPDLKAAMISPFLPLSKSFSLPFIQHPQHPLIPHGFTEAAAYAGAGIYMLLIISTIYIVYLLYTKKISLSKKYLSSKLSLNIFIIAVLAMLFYFIALGDFGRLSPYNIISHLPVLSSMRVSTRWFLFFVLCILILSGIAALYFKKRNKFLYFLTNILICSATIELFILNLGYQANILIHEPVLSEKSIHQQPFENTAYFGEKRQLPSGTIIPDDNSMPDMYREYEAMSYNLGVLYANDSFVQLHLEEDYRSGHPTCPFEKGCSFVKTDNAIVKYWSPNKIVLERTKDDPISLNMNNSSYFIINGKRNDSIRVAEPLQDFIITDKSSTITIEAQPSIIDTIESVIAR